MAGIFLISQENLKSRKLSFTLRQLAHETVIGTPTVISFECPDCDREIDTPKADAGTELTCPGCQAWVRVPTFLTAKTKPVMVGLTHEEFSLPDPPANDHDPFSTLTTGSGTMLPQAEPPAPIDWKLILLAGISVYAALVTILAVWGWVRKVPQDSTPRKVLIQKPTPH